MGSNPTLSGLFLVSDSIRDILLESGIFILAIRVIIVFFFLKTVSDNVRLIQTASNLLYREVLGGCRGKSESVVGIRPIYKNISVRRFLRVSDEFISDNTLSDFLHRKNIVWDI